MHQHAHPCSHTARTRVHSHTSSTCTLTNLFFAEASTLLPVAANYYGMGLSLILVRSKSSSSNNNDNVLYTRSADTLTREQHLKITALGTCACRQRAVVTGISNLIAVCSYAVMVYASYTSNFFLLILLMHHVCVAVLDVVGAINSTLGIIYAGSGVCSCSLCLSPPPCLSFFILAFFLPVFFLSSPRLPASFSYFKYCTAALWYLQRFGAHCARAVLKSRYNPSLHFFFVSFGFVSFKHSFSFRCCWLCCFFFSCRLAVL